MHLMFQLSLKLAAKEPEKHCLDRRASKAIWKMLYGLQFDASYLCIWSHFGGKIVPEFLIISIIVQKSDWTWKYK